MGLAYPLLVGVIAAQRLLECGISWRHQQALTAQGNTRMPERAFPLIVAVHVALLVGCLVEVALLNRPWQPALGIPMLIVLGLAMALRLWVWASMGSGWTVTVMIGPDLPICARGPYRWIRHPNYVAVIAEFVALPLVHGAWLTAIIASALNGWVLAHRIRAEERSLLAMPAYQATMAAKPRFLPAWRRSGNGEISEGGQGWRA